MRRLIDVKKAIKDFFKGGKEEALDNLVRSYYLLPENEKIDFFAMISEYGLSYNDFCEMAASFSDSKDSAFHFQEKLRIIKKRLVSPRERFFKSFINVRGGLKFLLDLRGDLLRLARRVEKFDWHEVDQDIVSLLDMWFIEGFLYLSEIGLDTPYSQISFIKEHDMVHPMTTMEDMVRRMGKDRLCYALYHILLPDEPVIFIEVALTDGIVGSIREIMETFRPSKRKDTAVFYSINNTQQGLSGLGLGKVLIARVVEEIRRMYPHIKNFSTLSPIPILWKSYMEPLLKREGANFKMRPEVIEKYFSKEGKGAILSKYMAQGGRESDFLKVLHEILLDTKWVEDKVYMKYLEKPLQRIVYFYLNEERDERGKPFDSVARFHLENGATLSLEHVRFRGNTYEYGVRSSLSFMVNYIYQLSWLEHIKEAIPSLRSKIKYVFPSKRL